MSHPSKTFVVEHLDPELEAWSSLEYSTIAKESHATGAQFLLSSVPTSLKLPENLQGAQGLNVETRGIEEIYADKKDRVCLLDPAAAKDLSPEDGDTFDIFLFGGILGDDPPRDRTSELRKKGYQGRRLGPVQMTTDTAVRVTRIVVQDRIPVDKIPFVDNPELKINKNESTQMPFRYVKGDDGRPIMPEGMVDLIIKDSEKSLDDLL
ncbi:SAM-dependent RNA methyltransferase [Phaeosphaeria sp. MPI-PUGE-AT-0046c]|nr:SAM-dependent RNA methyltransferase [Phaeosphaeria sp. MPI-PUGE-AT-0046c]